MTKDNYLIAVIDGQGGGIGKQYISSLKKALPDGFPVTVRALGTNSLATSGMLRAGADDGATGENSIIQNAAKADLIVGVMAIVIPHSILGELTPSMAEAIGASDAERILIPFDSCGTWIALLKEGSLQQYIDRAVAITLERLDHLTNTHFLSPLNKPLL